MARPTKMGLDYFPLDTHMEDKIKLIEAKYGIQGFGILIKLYQKIYDNGYYINWKEENILLFSSEVNVDINLVNGIINDCMHWHIFYTEKHKKYEILTSHGIQTRFIEAAKRRKKVEIITEYNLLKDDEINENIVFVNINPVNANINSKNDDNSTQSKVKESKEEESKEDKDRSPSIPYQDISELYNRYCPDMTKVIKMSDRRKEHLRARWKEITKLIVEQDDNVPEDIKEQTLSLFEIIFQKAGTSKFMNGKNDRNWHADFDWIIKNNNNFTKVLEGKYDNDKIMKASNSPPKSKTRLRIERAREKDKRRNQTS